jgi:hypothetical protein
MGLKECDCISEPLYASPVVPAPEGVFVSETCEGEVCWCGKPAVRKVGEEFAHDEPNPNRHNLTRYICAHHFAELMGPAGARSVGIAPVFPVGVSREVVENLRRQRDHPTSETLGFTTIRTCDADAILAALCQPVVPVGVSQQIGEREQMIAAMSIELEQHQAFTGAPTSSMVWASRMYDSAIAALRPTDTGRE